MSTLPMLTSSDTSRDGRLQRIVRSVPVRERASGTGDFQSADRREYSRRVGVRAVFGLRCTFLDFLLASTELDLTIGLIEHNILCVQ